MDYNDHEERKALNRDHEEDKTKGIHYNTLFSFKDLYLINYSKIQIEHLIEKCI